MKTELLNQAAINPVVSPPGKKLGVLEKFGLRISSSAWLSLVGVCVALSVLSVTSSAQAAMYRGVSVRTIQSTLSNAGYSPGGIDGIYGPNTRQAVIRFQRDRGLVADGIVGSRTARAMGLASNGGSFGGGTPAGTRLVTSRSGLNVRSGPGSGYRRLYGLSSGQRVSVTGTVRNGYRLLSSGGWVANGYLSGAGSSNSGGFGGGSGVLLNVRARRGVNVRSGPGTNYRVIGSLPNGAGVRVRVSDRSSNWTQLVNGGWVASGYLR